MSWLDDLLGNVLSFSDALLPQRKTWRIVSANPGTVTVEDNPTEETTDITLDIYGGSGRVLQGDGINPGLTGIASETFYPGVFAKGFEQSDLNGAPWAGASFMATAETDDDPVIWTAGAFNCLGDNGIGAYSEAEKGIGLWGDSEADGTSLKGCGVLGTASTGTVGAAVVGNHSNVASATIIAQAAGAGVYGYTGAADRPGVLGMSGDVTGVGVAGITPTLATPASFISGWSGAGVVGITGEAGKYGVGGEYNHASVYGEGVEGYSNYGAGVAGYVTPGGTFTAGTLGAIRSDVTGGAGVVGYRDFTLSFNNTDMEGAGVFGISAVGAGVKGMSRGASIPGVKGVGYSSGDASRGVEARAGATTGSALLAVSGSPTINVETIAATWKGSTIIALADTDAGGDVWSCMGLELFGTGGGEVIEAYAHKGTGVAGYTESTNAGIMGHGINAGGIGVLGVCGTTVGLQAAGFTATAGAGVGGYSEQVAGVFGVSAASGVPGVKGTATTGNARGGDFTGHGTFAGCYATGGASSGPGVVGVGGAGNSSGAEGYAAGNGAGVYGEAATGSAGFGIQGYTDGSGPAGYFENDGTGAACVGDASGGTGHGVVAKADTTSPTSAALLVIPQDSDPSSGVEGAVYSNSVSKKLKHHNGAVFSEVYAGNMTVNDRTSDINLTRAHCGQIFTNTSAAAQVQCNLPAAPVLGDTYTFVANNVGAFNFVINANTGQVIRLGATPSSSAGAAYWTGIKGAQVTMTYLATNVWQIITSTGTAVTLA